MAKGGRVLRGVFKDMLDDLLQVAEKKGGKVVAGSGERAGREAAEDAVKMATHNVPFRANWRGGDAQYFADEMRRQLDRQLSTFDGMTPRKIIERLERVDGPDAVKRTGAAQRAARDKFTAAVNQRQRDLLNEMSMADPEGFRRALGEFDVTPSGVRAADVDELARRRTEGFMKTVHALHEPDIIAGGDDVIGRLGGLPSLGLGNVNSAIGAQWKNLRKQLIDQLGAMPADIPIRLTHSV